MKLKGKLNVIGKVDVSYYGNPRYACEVDGTIFYTKPNCQLGYSITNYKDKMVEVQLRHYYKKLTLDTINEVKP